MGITGLLPFLKKASCPVNIKEFAGYTAAVDVYCWLHKSSYACAMDLALGNPTDQYVRYTLKYLEMLLNANIKPILVFDGANLPSKADTESKRKESKEAYRKKAAEYLLQGNREAAQECFQRSVFVTPKMANQVLTAARNLGVDCIVAPYEADAQLAYVNRAGYADLVITEDSDLLLFGCRQVIFKLDLTGAGVLVAVTAGIGELCCGMRPGQFSDNTLRHMGILAGCDYFSGIPGIGLVTAAKILRQTRLTDFRELLSKLGLYTNLSQAALTASISSADHKQFAINGKNDSVKRLHGSLIDAAVRAERTFRLQVIFDPLTRSQRRLTEPTPDDLTDEIRLSTQADSGIDVDDKENLFAFAGKIESDSAKAFQIALGNVDFKTGEVLSCFDPDQTQISIPATVSRPRSESSLLDHFTRVQPNRDVAIYSRSPSSVRPVLGVLSSSASQTVYASSQPDKQRLRMSIWDKDFPLQKVWIHRRLNQTDGQPSVHCLSVASVSPVKECSVIRNAATINTQDDDEGVLDDQFQSPITRQVRNVRIKSAHGKRLFVSNPSVQDKLNRLGKRPLLSDVPVRSPKREKTAASPPRPFGVDSVTDILKTYRSTSYESVTPNFHLPDRDLLPSTVLSSSDYFPRIRFDLESSVLHTKHREDEVASALQNALDKDADSDRLDPSRSPVFQRNPFRAYPRPQADSNVISSVGYSVGLNTSSSSDLLRPSLHNAPIPSAQANGTPPSPNERPTLDSFHFEKSPIFLSRAKPSVLQPSATAIDCDVAVDLGSTSSSPNLVDDVEEDDTGELTQLSPNFLNSHLSQPVAALIRPSVDTPNSSSSHYPSIAFAEASPVLKASDSLQLFGRSSVDKVFLKSPPINCRSSNHIQRPKRQSSTSTGRARLSVPRPSSSSNASLHSYFAKWKFKDAQC